MMKFPDIKNEELIKKLNHPEKKVDVVIDTDTYNEVDDQFAITYALRSSEHMSVEAIYAAPFHNNRSNGPKDGMLKSYEEIFKLLNLMDVNKNNFVFKGSTGYLNGADVPRESDAARDLIKRAKNYDEEEPLYVLATGAITNIASAILLEPEIIKNIVIVWLGGNAVFWPETREFNLRQDIFASKLILNCGVPLVRIPCMGVTSHLTTTIPELEYYLKNKSDLGTYLLNNVKDYINDSDCASKVIWDITTVAWLINPEWIKSSIVHSPLLTDNYTWSFDSSRHFIRSADFVSRDQIFADLFSKINKSK